MSTPSGGQSGHVWPLVRLALPQLPWIILGTVAVAVSSWLQLLVPALLGQYIESLEAVRPEASNNNAAAGGGGGSGTSAHTGDSHGTIAKLSRFLPSWLGDRNGNTAGDVLDQSGAEAFDWLWWWWQPVFGEGGGDGSGAHLMSASGDLEAAVDPVVWRLVWLMVGASALRSAHEVMMTVAGERLTVAVRGALFEGLLRCDMSEVCVCACVTLALSFSLRVAPSAVEQAASPACPHWWVGSHAPSDTNAILFTLQLIIPLRHLEPFEPTRTNNYQIEGFTTGGLLSRLDNGVADVRSVTTEHLPAVMQVRMHTTFTLPLA